MSQGCYSLHKYYVTIQQKHLLLIKLPRIVEVIHEGHKGRKNLGMPLILHLGPEVGAHLP